MKNIIFPILLTFYLSAHAQYNKRSNTYIGAVLGSGNLTGSAHLLNPDYTTGDFSARSLVGGMAAQFSGLGGETGLGFGGYFGVNLGGGKGSHRYTNTGTVRDGKWTVNGDFDFYVDLRLGGQIIYHMPEAERFIGIRYFYWANSERLRSWYSNADESGAIGLFGAHKKLGLELNYAAPKIPMPLSNIRWRILQIEGRYKVSQGKDGFDFLLGLRYERSGLAANKTTEIKNSVNHIMLLLVFGSR